MADRAGLDSSAYGTHSLRRTKPAQIYKKTGNLRAVLLLGHTKLESTVRYLGVEVDDALSISEQVELTSAVLPNPRAAAPSALIAAVTLSMKHERGLHDQ